MFILFRQNMIQSFGFKKYLYTGEMTGSTSGIERPCVRKVIHESIIQGMQVDA